MTSDDNKQDDLWDVQVSIAKAAAKLPNPSLAKLHHEVLEEIGHGPGLDLVDFFVGIAKISEKEIKEYFQYIGKSNKENTEEIKKDPCLLLADSIACGDSPTVLKFRHAFIKEHGEPPSEELTEYFLKKMQSAPRGKTVSGDKQAKFNFAEIIANRPNPTVLKLRHEFSKQYGSPPSGEITQYFLKKIQENTCITVPDEDYQSKVNFAKTVANGLISTILQFRKAFEKAYGETPSTEIIDVFIKNLPHKGEESRPL